MSIELRHCRAASLALLTLTALAGCDDDPPARPGPRDAGSTDAPFGGTCGETGQVIVFFEERCATSGCHTAGGRFPELTRNGLSRLTELTSERMPGMPLLVAGDPDGSFLYRKMAGTQGAGAGAVMPLGAGVPIPEATLIRAWIQAGASVTCDDLPPPRVPDDPNALDQGALFSCASPTLDSSPARLRRVERREWTHAAVKPLTGTWWGSTARDNPFAAPEGLSYSTYTRGVSVDGATLDLYMLVLPEAPAIWNARDPRSAPGFLPGYRTAAVYDDASLRCMFDDAAPSAACIDNYVDTLLREGVLFRSPSEGEHARLRALLVSTIAEEASAADRRASLLHVGQAAFLMTGALFRSEIGEPVEGDPAGRRRLSLDELALALGFALSTHPVGAPVPVSTTALPPTDPDSVDPSLGRLGRIRAAADDGTLYDPDVIRDLLATYRGGIDVGRHDLVFEADSRDLPARGEYWLAERIADFFREWLDYEGALTAFKDTPGATGRWDGEYGGDPMYDPTTLGFANLQHSFYGYESTLVAQLDDTIARAVIESDASGQDVFHALMTTRMWRLPSNLAMSNGVPCTTNADCTEAGFTSCRTTAGVCGNSSSTGTVTMLRPYDVTGNIEATSEARWVEMPEDDRMGVLTHPAWLAAHGGNFEDDASAVHRGHWIRENLFCQTVPGLENVMVEAQLVPQAPELSARARIVHSIEDETLNPLSPTCMGCHGLMNSLGFPFEIYNHAGFLRVWDHAADGSHGAVIGTSTITNAPDAALNGPVADAVELASRIADSPYARRCFLRQVFRFFMGRDEVASDACTLTAMEAALDERGSFFAVLEALVLSDSFQYRTIAPEAGGTP